MATIKGLDKVLRDLNKFALESEKEAKRIIWETVGKMISDAQQNAPRDLGRLIDSIDRESRDNGWTVVFFVGAEYGAFQEFGTGARVQVPSELQDVAAQFKGYKNGNFDQFLDNIRDWCSRHGIDPSAAYPIAVSILNKGLAPQPYFYPAYIKYKDAIVPEINKRFEELARRF